MAWAACHGSSASEAPANTNSKSTPALERAKPEPRVAPSGTPPEGARVVLLGTGTPVPDPERMGPASAVLAGGRAYLVDAGPGIVRRAAAAEALGHHELAPEQLSHVFITHLHSDHTVGYADLMLTPAVVGRRQPLQAFGPPGLTAMTRALERAYAVDASIRHAGKSPEQQPGYRVVTREIEAGEVYTDAAVRVRAVKVPHGSVEHAYAYRFDAEGRSIVFSGDTAPSEALVELCSGCDLLVHEVYCSQGVRTGPPSFREYHGSFHTSAQELAALATRARPGLLLLSHLLFFGCDAETLLAEVKSGYAGEVVVGEDLGVY
ncbi:MAG: MBL fold metallo-hydrolase [Myxococcales bacterium]|nr:MBL fold metallo-hydrolase [Myxococcales bacterium]